MSDRITIKPLAGRLDGYVGVDYTVAIFGVDQQITELFPIVATAPTTAPAVVEIRGPTQTISASIPVGQVSPAAPATGLIDLAAGETLVQRVTAAEGARELSGWFTTQAVGAVPTVVDLTTLAEVKRYMGIADAAHDALLGDLISRTSEAIRKYTDRQLTTQILIGERHDGNNDPYLFPVEYPIQSVQEIRVYTDVSDPADYQITSNGYMIESRMGDFSSTWPKGRQNIEIDYTAGYPTVPYDLMHAATLSTGREFMRTQPGGTFTMGRTRATASSGGDTEWETGLFPDGAMQIIDLYKRMTV